MTFTSINSTFGKSTGRLTWSVPGLAALFLAVSGAIMLLTGCGSAPASSAAAQHQPSPAPAVAGPSATTVVAVPAAATPPDEGSGKLAEIVTIREGDVLKISFPGAPKLDTTQQVRSDGVVTLDILGEVKVTGQSPKELEKTLAQMFSSQLVSNEVTVAILSSTFDVYVTGAVLRPGKISTTKPITAFQAIMEAGYDPVNSNLEKVTLIREVGREKYTYIALNLQLVLEGKETTPFYLKPSDTLQVPKKISIF